MSKGFVSAVALSITLISISSYVGVIAAEGAPSLDGVLLPYDEFDRNDLVSALEGEVPFLDMTGDTEKFRRATTQQQFDDHAKRQVQIIVHKSMKERGYQFVQVLVDGVIQIDAPISTAWERLAPAPTGAYMASTPSGKFVPDLMQSKRYSNKWKVWLKWVIPFNNGVWMHSTTPDHYAELGAPASGGCVRVHLDDAAKIYAIVERFGLKETAITVLPQDADEKQIPWKARGGKRAMPEFIVKWQEERGIK